MIHFICAVIIRLHPTQFRERFGPEMASAVQQAIADGWGVRLIFDGVVSLARQWLNVVDGSARALHARVPGRPEYLETMRQRSIEISSRIWRINAAWTMVLIVLYGIGANWPVTLYRAPWLVVPVVLCLLLILRTSPSWMDGPLQTMSVLSLKDDPPIAQLEIQRSRLDKWSSTFVLMVGVMAGMQNVTNLLMGYENLDTTQRLVRLSILAAVLILAVVLVPRYLRRANRAAARVLQDEIDAIRNFQSKGLIEDRF